MLCFYMNPIPLDENIKINEDIETDLNNYVILFGKNNKTDQAIKYLKSLYHKIGEVFILDLCDDLAFKFGHLGELKEIKRKLWMV